MKKVIVLCFFVLIALSGMMFTACPTDSGSSSPAPEPTPAPAPEPTTGTLIVHNTQDEYAIIKIEITKLGQTTATASDTTPVYKGGSKSFTLEPGGYTVVVTDNTPSGWTTSKSVSVEKGKTTDVSYDGMNLR